MFNERTDEKNGKGRTEMPQSDRGIRNVEW
jgi:hypothetical protein